MSVEEVLNVALLATSMLPDDDSDKKMIHD